MCNSASASLSHCLHTLHSSLAIDAFTETYKSTPTIYFYCSYGELERREAAPVLATLLKQLSMRSENMDPQLVAVFDKGISMSMELSAKSLRAALARFEQTFIVVDALDECSKDERKLLVSFLAGLIRSNPHGVKLLLTSRPESDLEQLLKNSSKFLINANDTTKDIRPYVKVVLTEHIANCAILDGVVKPELKQRLINTISDQADGMFLWAKLQLDHICKEPNEEAIISQLGKLPLGLDNTYDRIWKGITGPLSTANEKKYALRTLKWVLHAKRPLSPQEILEATALEVDSESSIVPPLPQQASSPDYLVRVCGNFIALDKETNAFRFIHYSVQEFLKEIPDLSDDDTLGNACLTVLGLTTTKHEKQNLNIYQYAAHNWEKHCDSWTTIAHHRGMLIKSFLLNASAFAEWQRHRGLQQGFRSAGYYRLTSYFNLPVILEHLLQLGHHQSHQPELSAALVIAADRGYLMVARHLVREGANPNSRGGWCGTPLQAASYRGFGDVVKLLLLQVDIEIDAIGGYYGSALNAAIASRSESVMRQLLTARANANSHGDEDGPVLRAAVLTGSELMVEMLLAAGADVNAQSEHFSSALYTAAREGNENLVQLLLNAGADVNALTGKHSGSALYIAAGKGAVKVVEQLLTAGADPNIQGGRYWYPLYYAARGGHSRIVQLLVDARADVNSKIGRPNWDALGAAIFIRSLECVEILINANANVQATENSAPLQTAAFCGYEELVDILLDSGANPNASGTSPSSYCFPLTIAVKGGFGGIVERLIRAGVNVNQIDVGRTALGLAVSRGFERTVELLLAAGANPNSDCYWPLQEAVEMGSETMVNQLLAAGAKILCAQRSRHSVLVSAVYLKNIRMVERLLEAGVDIDSQSWSGQPALLCAVITRSLEIVEVLLNAGADARAGEGDLSLPDSALYAAIRAGDPKIILALLKAGADIDAEGGENGCALHMAACIGEDDIIELLLKAGADVNAQGGQCGFALQTAASQNMPRVLKRLLLAGADAGALGGKYGSALHGAAYILSMECVELLLNAGADVNAAGGEFGSVLQTASGRRGCDGEIVERLLMAGADVNALGGESGFALQAAAYAGNTKDVKILLTAGADPNARGGKHGSALQAAASASREECIELLLKAGANVNSRGGLYGSPLKACGGNSDIRGLLLSWGATDDSLGDSDVE